MISSLIETLELPSFGYITKSTIWFESNEKNILGDVMDRNYDAINLFQNTYILRMPRVAIFADTMKFVIMFIKIISKDSKRVKRIKNYVSKYNLYLYFLI